MPLQAQVNRGSLGSASYSLSQPRCLQWLNFVRKVPMSTPATKPESEEEKDGELPIGQHEGEGTNAVTTHKPDLAADPLPDGHHRYLPRTGYNHGND